jgi:5-methylcytosine-specific restriction endonuclease McrA
LIRETIEINNNVMSTVALYNMSFQKIIDIDWKHAVVLVLNNKVSPCADEYMDIRTASGVFKLPLHIILKKYVHIPYKEIATSRKNIFTRDDYTCQYCSCKLDNNTATVDHVLPRSRGGKHEWTNVTTSCLRCNRKKGDRTPHEANMPLMKQPKSVKFGCY